MLRPASLEKHDRPVRDSAVLRFPSLEIGDADLIVGVRLRFRRYVRLDCRRDQPVQRNLIDGLVSLREVNRCVNVSPAVLGCAELIR